MAFDEMHRRQQAIARRRKKTRKFSLLLGQITVPSSRTDGRDGNKSRMKYVLLSFPPIFLVLWLFFGKSSTQQSISQTDRASTVRNKYWKANVVQHMEDTDGSDDTGDKKQNKKQSSKIIMSNSSRPFLYIGDYDPAKPKPWPKEEKDWWILHDKLTKSVRASDALPPLKFDINESRLPQLIFYGDSITEGWGGTSFGMVPGPHRMWKPEEHKEIRQLFANTFGDLSTWGKRALKPPLVLGISGSRTYDFLWRINNGEFPTSQLLGNKEEEQRQEEGEDDDSIKNRFQLDKLERVYIVLMGTNNLGGGMLPGPTVEGMDAVGRSILQLHKDTFPNTPSAILFSELLPRKDNFRAEKMCPPRCANETTLEPYKSFMPAIDKVNRALPDVVDGWRNDFENSRIVLLTSQKSEPDAKDDVDDEDETAEGEPDNDYTMTINCGRDMFAIEGEDDEFDAYMPDRLHPNAKGYKLWSRCLKRGLDAVMDHTISLEGEK